MKVLKKIDLIIPLLIFLYSLSYFWEVNLLPNKIDLLLIRPIFFILVLAIIIHVILQFRTYKTKTNVKQTEEKEQINWKKTIYFCLSTVLYVFLLESIGFIILTLVYMVVLMWGLGVRSKKALILTPLISVFSIYISLELLLSIKLPKGVLVVIGGIM